MKSHTFTIIISILLSGMLLIVFPSLAQNTWYVDDDAPNDPGPGDPSVSDPEENGSTDHPFDAIQEGIDAAADGDTVMVADGTYTGDGNRDIDFIGKAIRVQSENGAEYCIVDCQASSSDSHWGFYFDNSEENDRRALQVTDTQRSLSRH